MGRLTAREAVILLVAACAVVLMALAVADLATGGGNALDYVELSLTTAVLARVV